MRLALLALVVLTLAAGAARADEEADGGTRISYSHRHQLGVHAQLGLGYRVLFPYESDTVYCGQAGKSVCTGSAPLFLETGLSFGVSRSVELLADFRFGLQEDFKPDGSAEDSPRAFALQPGVKIYIDDEGSMKFFSTLQLSFDFTDFSVNGADEGTDFAVRNVNGLQIDLHKTFGFYVFAGPTIGFVRWLRFEIDGGLGLQARFP